MSDFGSFRQKPHPLHETKLLTPLPESHTHIFQEESFYRSLTGAGRLADVGERPTVARISEEYSGDTQGSRIRRIRELQSDHLNPFHLVYDHVDQWAWRLTVLLRRPRLQASRISSFNSADAFTTQQSRGRVLARRGLRYKVRIATVPNIVMVCGIVAGIQTAR